MTHRPKKPSLCDCLPVSLIDMPATWLPSIIVSLCCSNEVYCKMKQRFFTAFSVINNNLINNPIQSIQEFDIIELPKKRTLQYLLPFGRLQLQDISNLKLNRHEMI